MLNATRPFTIPFMANQLTCFCNECAEAHTVATTLPTRRPSSRANRFHRCRLQTLLCSSYGTDAQKHTVRGELLFSRKSQYPVRQTRLRAPCWAVESLFTPTLGIDKSERRNFSRFSKFPTTAQFLSLGPKYLAISFFSPTRKTKRCRYATCFFGGRQTLRGSESPSV